MTPTIHFISGLPRSGSTLLAAILRQNPTYHAAMASPLAEMFISLMRSMSGANEFSLFITEQQRHRVLRSIVESYYADLSEKRIIFDTNRAWCSLLPALANLFPEAQVICCVRSPAWILDSTEQQVQRNALQPSKIFGYDVPGTVYQRAESMMKGPLLGTSLRSLRQAWFGDHAHKLVAIRYNSLTDRPLETMTQLYASLGEEYFAHDFDHLAYEEPDFDARLGLPGFHTVARRVESRRRQTILPPDLFSQHDSSFWDMPGQNPRNVRII